MKKNKVCIDCGKKLHKRADYYGTIRCRSCSSKFRYKNPKNNPNYKGGITLTKYNCEICGKEISYRNAIFGKSKCQECYTKTLSGKNNPNWRGGRSTTYGYILIFSPKHPFAQQKYVTEHRLVMEKQIGRYLKPEEIVHHINGIRNDNRIENLMLFNNIKEHREFHSWIFDFIILHFPYLMQQYINWYNRKRKEKDEV